VQFLLSSVCVLPRYLTRIKIYSKSINTKNTYYICSTDLQAVEKMYNGLSELIRMEKELEVQHAGEEHAHDEQEVVGT
jgi:hypothetical protein